jgi:hypothetical protein
VRGSLLAGAAVILFFAFGAIVLGRWERSHAIDTNRSGIARARSEAGPDLLNGRLTSVVSIAGLTCTQYRLQPTVGISLCWDGSGRLVEAVRFDSDRTKRWSLAEHRSAATIHAPVGLLAALTPYVAVRPKALAVAAALRNNLKPCLQLTKQVLKYRFRRRLALGAARRVVDNCSNAQALISAATTQAPEAATWLGTLPLRFGRLAAAVVYAAQRLSFRLQHPRAIPKPKRSALAVYRERRKSAIARGVPLRRELKQAIARQVESVRALER